MDGFDLIHLSIALSSPGCITNLNRHALSHWGVLAFFAFAWVDAGGLTSGMLQHINKHPRSQGAHPDKRKLANRHRKDEAAN